MSAQQQKIRRIVWTGAIASVTMTGVWYGAGLKSTREVKQVCQVFCFGPLCSLFGNGPMLMEGNEIGCSKTTRSYGYGKNSNFGGAEGRINGQEIWAGKEDT